MDRANQVDRNDDEINKLERQVERSQLFTHTALSEGLARVGETTAFVLGLIDVLLAKGVVNEDEVQSAVENVHQQMATQGEFLGAGTFIRLEKVPEMVSSAIEVDCQTRLPICQAACCKLNFALTISEIESGGVKWDLGRPYYIRHEENGYCTHLQQNCGCRIYTNRPGVCQDYSCAKDDRIWKDFVKMELNTEWIATNLPPKVSERLVGTFMEKLDTHVSLSDVQ